MNIYQFDRYIKREPLHSFNFFINGRQLPNFDLSKNFTWLSNERFGQLNFTSATFYFFATEKDIDDIKKAMEKKYLPLDEFLQSSRSDVNLTEPDLDTHILDICQVLEYEDLNEVILDGHSYGGLVIGGVAEQMPKRIRRLVYLDGYIPGRQQECF